MAEVGDSKPLAPETKGWRLVAAGDRTCLLRRQDTICWGEHGYVLGAPNEDDAQRVKRRMLREADEGQQRGWRRYFTGDGVVDVTVSARGLCALGRDHRVRCWDQPGHDGELDELMKSLMSPPSQAPLRGPREVEGLGDVVDLVGAPTHTASLASSGQVMAWGFLPHEVTTADLGASSGLNFLSAWRYAPRALSELSPARELSASAGGTCSILRKGGVRCLWYLPARGAERLQKLDVDATAVAVAGEGACLLGHDRRVRCFARDDDTLVNVRGLEGVVSVAASSDTFCARRVASPAACWRFPAGGEAPAPKKMEQLPADVRQLALGSEHVCGLRGAGQVVCLGANHAFQLGHPPRRTAEVRWLRGATRILSGGKEDDEVCGVLPGGTRCIGFDGQQSAIGVRARRVIGTDISRTVIDEQGRLTSWTYRGDGCRDGHWLHGPGRCRLAEEGRPTSGPARMSWVGPNGVMLRDEKGAWWRRSVGPVRSKDSIGPLPHWGDVRTYARAPWSYAGSLDASHCVVMSDGAYRCMDARPDVTQLRPDLSQRVLSDVRLARGWCYVLTTGEVHCDDSLLRREQGRYVLATKRVEGLPPSGIERMLTSTWERGCVLTRDRSVYCWSSGKAEEVETLNGALDIASSDVVCGLFDQGKVRCTGRARWLSREEAARPVGLPPMESLPTPAPRG